MAKSRFVRRARAQIARPRVEVLRSRKPGREPEPPQPRSPGSGDPKPRKGRQVHAFQG